MITGQTAGPRPPVFHVHKYDASVDTVDDLNAWTVNLFSPLYSEASPAFAIDALGNLHTTTTTGTWFDVPDGFWVVLNATGNISILSDLDFQTRYTLA